MEALRSGPIGRFLPFIIGGVAVVVVGAGMFIAGQAMAPKPEVAADVEHKKEAKKTEQKKEEHGLPVYVLKDRVVNLADPGTRRYLRISLGFEFDEGGLPESIVKKSEAAGGHGGGGGGIDIKKFTAAVDSDLGPFINHEVTQILSALTSQELATPDGKDKMLKQIKQRVNDRVGPKLHIKVKDVLLTDFVIQ